MRAEVDRSPLLRFRRPGLVLLLALAYGTVGDVLIERWSPLDAIYMTLITITTVGFGEVHTLSPAGRIFTSSLIVGGVGTMLYAFGIFTEMLSQGHISIYRRQRSMERRIAALRDHFIICGYGRIGTRIAHEFERHETGCVVIDNNPEAVRRLEREGRLHLAGDAAGEDVLEQAGIRRARGLISAVDSDERAVYIVLAARALNPGLYVLARAGQPESIRRLELAGANRVVSPYRMAGHTLAELALRPAVVDVMDTIHHGESDIGVEEVLVNPGSQAAGKTLADAGLTGPNAGRLLAVRRPDGTMHVNPDASLLLAEGDLIVAFGTVAQLEATAAYLQ